MEYLAKAAIEKRVWRRYLVTISLVGTVALLGLILAIISMSSGKFLFALWYLIAFCLGFFYVAIRINMAFPTYLATDGEKLVFSIWQNGVFPYKVMEKSSFILDFIPEKVKRDEIAFSELDRIYIGSKKYLKKTLEEGEYPDIFNILEMDKQAERIIKRMDFVIAFTQDGKSCFMSVTDFDIAALSEVIDVVERNCQGVKIHNHLPKLVRMRKK